MPQYKMGSILVKTAKLILLAQQSKKSADALSNDETKGDDGNDDKSTTSDGDSSSSKPPTTGDKAADFGYDKLVKDPPFNPHGQKVYTNGKDFITPNVDKHNGGEWERFDRRGTRIGTYDADLNRIGK